MTSARTLYFLNAVIISLIGFSHPSYSEQNNVKPLPPVYHYVINYAKAAPVIDGNLNDDAWNSATFTADFVQHVSGETPALKTHAKLLYDVQCLYIGVETEDEDIFTYFTHNDDPLFLRDDLAEIFIDPNEKGKNYIEIGISASGLYYGMAIPESNDGLVKPNQFKLPKMPVGIMLNGTLNNPDDKDKSWSLEACIPLSVIAKHTKNKLPITEKTHWNIGLYRIDYDHTTEKSKALGFYSWQYLGKFGFHRPERFGKVTFGKN